ncbi:MAG TPA: hypothetical protein VFF01_01895, partial [Candidatus Deferrimicrobiaceae bacterium]|nr:hypothetical protein [Candidatus Deferrimicrobiaceae bacterium]
VPPGDYEILVMARAAGSSTAFQADNSIIYTIGTPSIAVSLAANPASPQLPGTAVTFTAAATGGSGTYQYQFLGRQVGQPTFNVVQPYGPANTWNWTAVAGSWEIQVQARNAGSAAAFEGLQTITYDVTVPPVTAVTLTATPASPQTAGTSITFTGTATGGSGNLEYQFLGRQVGSPTFGVAQPYGPSNTWTWTGIAGSWEIQVQARSVGSIAPFDASATITDIVN